MGLGRRSESSQPRQRSHPSDRPGALPGKGWFALEQDFPHPQPAPGLCDADATVAAASGTHFRAAIVGAHPFRVPYGAVQFGVPSGCTRWNPPQAGADDSCRVSACPPKQLYRKCMFFFVSCCCLPGFLHDCAGSDIVAVLTCGLLVCSSHRSHFLEVLYIAFILSRLV